MMFQCEGENDFISIDVNTDDKFKLVFNSDDTNLMIYISFQLKCKLSLYKDKA